MQGNAKVPIGTKEVIVIRTSDSAESTPEIVTLKDAFEDFSEKLFDFFISTAYSTTVAKTISKAVYTQAGCAGVAHCAV